MPSISISISTWLIEQVKDEAAKNKTTVSGYIFRALQDALKKNIISPEVIIKNELENILKYAIDVDTLLMPFGYTSNLNDEQQRIIIEIREKVGKIKKAKQLIEDNYKYL